MIHQNVEKVRKAKGVTKTYIAKKLDMSLQGYTHLVSGGTRLGVERLAVIAVVLGVEPGVFFDDKLTEAVIKQINSVSPKTKTG